MSRVRIGLTTIFLLSASLCAPSLFGQAAIQQQSAAPLPSAKQIADDEEKNLLAAVQAAESDDAAPKELTAKLEALARFLFQPQSENGTQRCSRSRTRSRR